MYSNATEPTGPIDDERAGGSLIRPAARTRDESMGHPPPLLRATILDMTAPDQVTRDETAALLAEHGFAVTEEGKAQARAKLREAERRITPERREQLRSVGRTAA